MSYVLTKMTDIIEFNPRETIARKQVCKKVPMEYLQPFTRQISGFEEAPYAGGTKFRNNDTIMARITPCLENGKTAFVKGFAENEVVFGSTEYIVMRAIPGASDPVFIYYLATSPSFREVAIKSMVGSSGRQRVQQDVLENLELVLPDYETQVRVGKVLSAFDDKIELNAQINHNLEEQAKAIFKSWFVDFEPFQDGKFVDSELRQIPAGWQVADVYSIASVIYGAPFASKRFSAEKIGRPIVRIRDLATEAPQVYTDEIHPKGYIIKPGDIVVGMDGEFRAYLWGGEEAWLNQRVCVFQPKDNFSSAFVRLSIMPLLAAVEASEVATTVIHLGKNDIDKFKIILPDAETLRKYNAVAVPIYKQIVENKLESRRLAQLRDTLLPKLMSGEIDVSEVEI